MKFSTREDIEASIDRVWAAVSDFDSFERQALRRGAEVTRTDGQGAPGIGSEWEVTFTFRGRPREIEAKIAEFDRPNTLSIDSHSGGLDGQLRAELLALSPRRTRLMVSLDLRPRNLAARLMIQSMKLAKSKISKRFANRIYDFAKHIEDKHGSGRKAQHIG
ncbi:SRPBCC family protein [Pseudoruegeria sp. HB172150]|uniref:SRPBCC family protein n=1 Tax=Pseudoruegeria sp. HB172150 TaxID=2721164 RepID=UPI0015581326|nr:SRPBCC family protein [Pseudoruegeria sp. HB172150]